jgi:L-ascorbate metabolism protein UlaG (beta-lactamase superfamily)
MQVKVRYIGHSGFCVEVGRWCLVFDYYTGKEPLSALSGAEHPVVFASHSHGDHFNPRILGWKEKVPGLGYVFSYDIPVEDMGVVLSPGGVWEQDGLRVLALPSTDAGVAFWVEAEGVAFFHAGDLNDWHWMDDSTALEAEMSRQAFARALSGLEGRPVDVAFVPVDPRLGSQYDRGARYSCRSIQPKHFFPMHFGEDYRVPADFELWAREACPSVHVHDILRMGQSYTLNIGEDNAS